MRKNVLLLETIADEAFAFLQQHVNVFTGYDEASLNNVLNKEDIHAIITRGKGLINKPLIDAFPHLQVVARCGVGLDNVDVAAATVRKIMVINAPGSNAATIAEHTLSLMLMLMRNMYESVSQVKQNNWNWRNQYTGDELNGKTLGVLGMGNIGKRVARIAEAFGMEVLYWSKSVQDLPYKYLPMEDVLRYSDVVSLHLPFNNETGKIIGEEQLRLMKPGSLLINTARGALIDHPALLQALNSGVISGFAADVLPDEPPVESLGIVHHPRVIITPHTGSLTSATYRQICLLTINNVVAALTGRNPEPGSIFNRSALH
ncbi:phosphoglycerate dehydrogenase [Chitinophaga ginsengisegetis]|uniref:2-hydroxyacid dehydrogenase n=1 Tax=Chitinophaga ginsengisegetis TaxID=393003 RepID=UPI000DBAB81A|nr:NAD(P)-dependent oxidoreductase [Chitinophaga ginsengisegetis]MDR6571079.1 D-3-phosphoglycerate dehydrogenase [Chitinophaga ginsengisegetis]MDR6650813.1 D-3-phosphoglycerate dehydrogenase [Chitinophaga ginsengisegetis]MDR6657167.1 D-3-phosphoglycerate dehydrogenase [Chitinophaga ginsengisegetis]